MLSPRKETILKSIVGQYISQARPVPSQSVIRDCELGISSATVRNEMVQLEQEGFITRPHPSSGSVPSDQGYRQYVASIGNIKLPLTEQRRLSHLFHQVEGELDKWLRLAVTLVAQMVQNMAMVTMPKPEACRFKHLELVSLQDSLVLVILVLNGAKVRQQLLNLNQVMSQAELTAISNRMSDTYSGFTSSQILDEKRTAPIEQQLTDCLLRLMENEDEQESEEPYLDGLHLIFNQPEFAHDHRMALTLMEMIEQRNLLKSILPSEPASGTVHVIIGKENRVDAIHDYSVVFNHYGLPDQVAGTISVIGPTRMPYARTIATIDYLSSLLSGLIATLYGRTSGDSGDDTAKN